MRLLHHRGALHAVPSGEAPPSGISLRLRPTARARLATGAAHAAVGVSLLLGSAVAAVLLVLLCSIASPIGFLVLAWMTWRAGRDTKSALGRLQARWGRSARVLSGGAAQR